MHSCFLFVLFINEKIVINVNDDNVVVNLSFSALIIVII